MPTSSQRGQYHIVLKLYCQQMLFLSTPKENTEMPFSAY